MRHIAGVGLVLTFLTFPVAQAQEEAPSLKREQQMTYAPLSVDLPLGNVAVTEPQFHDAARRAFSRRHWAVLEAKGNVVRGELVRKGAIYRVEMELKGAIIELRYLPTYSDKRPNYLHNLRRDLAFELRVNP